MTPATPEAGQSVSFTATSTGGVGGVSLSWAFGDGNSATGNPVSESYQAPGSFTVSVTAVDSNGAVATSSQTLTLASTVTVDFTNTPSQPDAGQTVGFTSSIRGGIQPYSSSWNFGDAGVGSGGSVAHSYQASGNYTVVLTVTDGNGLVARASRTITVNPPLSTSFTYSPSNPLPLLPIQFMGSATGGSQQYTYMWDFGDGSNATGSTVSHSYILPGTYTVTIAVTDTNGQTATASTTIVVSIQVLGI